MTDSQNRQRHSMETLLTKRLGPLLRLAVEVEAKEVSALLWAFFYFFSLLCSYYILRPLRDEMGVASGVENLQWLFTGTFVAMLLAVPLFGRAVAAFPRHRLVPGVYWFFLFNILLFYLLLSLDLPQEWIARAFFVWVSLFNLFVVSVFWSFLADIFTSQQGKRLFGFVAAGGSAGAILGPSLTASLAVPLGPVNLLLCSAVFLLLAIACIHGLLRHRPSRQDQPQAQTLSGQESRDGDAVGGSLFGGVTLLLKSPHLLRVCLYILLFTTTSTFLYFQQAHLVSAAFDDPGERTRIFALIDLSVGVLTVLTQLCITGRVLKRFGLGLGLAVLPLLTLVGFAAFATLPLLTALIAFQSIRRATNFAISKPAREVLFTAVTREEKYKCKNFLDTVVYRGGDAASGWAFAGLTAAGLSLPIIAGIAAALSGLWLLVALRLGRDHELATEGTASAKPAIGS